MFDSRGFTQDERISATVEALRNLKKTRLQDLTPQQRETLFAEVVAGKFDKFKVRETGRAS
jgi:hypothetical protein